MPNLRPYHLVSKLSLLAPLAALAAAPGCAAGTPEIAERASAVEGGEASTEKSVVAIITSPPGDGAKRLCTGTLISPRVVLTARHCVAPFESATLRCGQAPLGEPYAGERFLVFSGDDAARRSSAPPEAQRGVLRAEVPPDGNDVCGYDIAILVLGRSAGPELEPLELRTEAEIAPGDRYRMVGYGAADPDDAGSGPRRGRDDLSVSCVAAECPVPTVAAGEWRGEAGVCSGDSGGPAIDAEGRVVGVASRGKTDSCDDPIYTSVYRWRDWLREAVTRAAAEPEGEPEGEPGAGGEPKAEPTQGPAPVAASDDGCGASGRPSRAGGVFGVCAALALASLGRARRRTPN